MVSGTEKQLLRYNVFLCAQKSYNTVTVSYSFPFGHKLKLVSYPLNIINESSNLSNITFSSIKMSKSVNHFLMDSSVVIALPFKMPYSSLNVSL